MNFKINIGVFQFNVNDLDNAPTRVTGNRPGWSQRRLFCIHRVDKNIIYKLDVVI